MLWAKRQNQATITSLLYLVIFGPSICSCYFNSSLFVKLQNLEFICDLDRLPLLPSSTNNFLMCAAVCQGQPDCAAFLFTLDHTSSHGDRLGACLWSPSDSITGVSFTSAAETWLKVLSHLAPPPALSGFPLIPGALQLGRFLVVRGRVPDPAPEQVSVGFIEWADFHPLHVIGNFDFTAARSYRMSIHTFTREDQNWKVQLFPVESFPLKAGQDFEVCALATREWYRVYIDSVFLANINRSTTMVEDIYMIQLTDADFYTVTFN
ncbi:hypothetical protein PoB_000368900 [Plakobranchus ocellatus]|uniref:Galectin n=1 Tax=Plakobranchus ocellatus TaxID=259542 RepID=A0AAV3Y529_9GAST|nr:hypothetical protein PoB_000368900 [Plakobranchus ocellatus]